LLYCHCFSNFVLEYTSRKVQKNQVGLKVNETHQLLVYDDDVNLLRDNIDKEVSKAIPVTGCEGL
jgi:hypothetical protein